MTLYLKGRCDPITNRDPTGLCACPDDPIMISRDWDDIYDSITANGSAYLGAQGAATFGAFWGGNVALAPRGAAAFSEISQGVSDLADQYAEEFIELPMNFIPGGWALSLVLSVGRHADLQDIKEQFLEWIGRGEKDYHVYIGYDKSTGEAKYVGFTGRLKGRQGDWKDKYRLEPVASGLTKNEARSVEQAIINQNPGFDNKINSISRRRPFFEMALEWGEDFIRKKKIKIR
jgi:hypothetical protein